MSTGSGDLRTHDLVQEAKAGGQEALDQLLRRHLPSLRVFIRARSGPVLRMRESQSDLVQTVCREALKHLDQYEWRGDGSFRHWLFSVALHKLQKKQQYHKAARRDPAREVRAGSGRNEDGSYDLLAEVYKTMGTPSQDAMAREMVEAIEEALDRIPEQYREIILLSRVVGMSHDEIASHLNKTKANVRVLLGRALARLATAMEKS